MDSSGRRQTQFHENRAADTGNSGLQQRPDHPEPVKWYSWYQADSRSYWPTLR